MGNKVIDGGFYRGPNRWIDAGYADAAPASVTLVYNFLCRWAHNETWTVQQTMAAIRRGSGVRTERYIREALEALEAWGVISVVRKFSNRPTLWQLHDLPRQAPPYPTKAAKSRASAPSQSEGAGKGRNEDPGAVKVPPKESSTLSPSTGAPGTWVPSAGVLTDPPYQTAFNQTEVNQTAPTISSSGAEAPTDDANRVGANPPPSAVERATPLSEPLQGDGRSPELGMLSQRERRSLVKEIRDALAANGHDYVLRDEQAHGIYAGRTPREVLDESQFAFWLEHNEQPAEVMF